MKPSGYSPTRTLHTNADVCTCYDCGQVRFHTAHYRHTTTFAHLSGLVGSTSGLLCAPSRSHDVNFNLFCLSSSGLYLLRIEGLCTAYRDCQTAVVFGTQPLGKHLPLDSARPSQVRRGGRQSSQAVCPTVLVRQTSNEACSSLQATLDVLPLNQQPVCLTPQGMRGILKPSHKA